MSLFKTIASGAGILVVGAAVLATATTVSYVKYISPSLPDVQVLKDWKPSEGTVILGRDGTVLGQHSKERRKFVPLADIPDIVVEAFVSAEDGNYWRHSGIDPAAIVRAALANFKSGTGERPEGGSTITQQVVKNVLLSSERTFDRKIKEAILAVRADREIGKSRMLEIYLNEIYFGSGAYGVDVASETYFGKSLRDLTVAEAALLAGLPKAPSAANPFSNPIRATERRNYVLRRMTADGYLTGEQYSLAASAELPRRRADGIVSPETAEPAMWYPQEAVRRSLVKKIGNEELLSSGGEIRTTISPALQRVVHSQLRKSLVFEDRRSGWRGVLSSKYRGMPDWDAEALTPPPGAEDWQVAVVSSSGRDAVVATKAGEVTISGASLAWATRKRRADAILKEGDVILVTDFGNGTELVQVPKVQGAVVVLDPRDGSILALDGGFSHEISEFDRATQARRQTGSAFKPFVYLAAVEMGYSAMSPILDSPIAIEQGPGLEDWRPKSGHDEGLGLITLRRAIEMSRNMSTARLLYDIGIDAVTSVAARAGFIVPPSGATYAMALGAVEATPMEVATGYAALANGGKYVVPTFVAPPAGVEPAKVFDPVATAQISSMLEGVVTHGTAKQAFEGFDRPLAAKTGTTNDARDAWLAAYGPEMVIVGWVGRDDRTPLASGSSGGGTAAPLVRAILDNSEGLLSFPGFTLPDGAATVRADRSTGALDPEGDVVEIIKE